MQGYYEFFIVTSAYDLGASKPYDSLQTNQWNSILIGNIQTKIWYANSKIKYSHYRNIIKDINTDYVYLNCMYSYRFFLFPLLNRNKLFHKETKFIISPRGILQPGSLAIKSNKKLLYLQLLKKSRLLINCAWHASGKEEFIAIQKKFGLTTSIQTISNIPKRPSINIQKTEKKNDILKLVHLSLISPVKNIKKLIQVLAECTQQVTLDIYGPIKDETYWNECKKVMLILPSNIKVIYKGDLQPNKVQQTLKDYDSLISLTTGENFGHALYESLSVGRPIITSYYTPWNSLEEKKAGWNVDISNKEQISELLNALATKSNNKWQVYCEGAHQLAKKYFVEQNFEDSYRKLFS